MCQYNVRVRGVKVCGRRVYRTDTGIRLGYRGPTVSLASALACLSNDLANTLATACEQIDRKMTLRQSALVTQLLDAEDSEQQAREVFGDEPDCTVLTLNPPHVAEQMDETTYLEDHGKDQFMGQ